jgi:hypothetical protein
VKAMHLGSPTYPVCGQRVFYGFMLTTDPVKVTCKLCLRSRDYRMVSERLRRRLEAEATP